MIMDIKKFKMIDFHINCISGIKNGLPEINGFFRQSETISDTHFYNISKKSFRLFINFTGSIHQRGIRPLDNLFSFYNNKLKTSASRISVPAPVEVYKYILGKTYGFNFDRANLGFTSKEVKEADRKALLDFQEFQPFIHTARGKLSEMLLIKSAIQTALELGIIKTNSDVPSFDMFRVDSSSRVFRHGGYHSFTSPDQAINESALHSSAGYPNYGFKDAVNNIEFAQQFYIKLQQGDFDTKFLVSLFMSFPTTIFHRFQYSVMSQVQGIKKKSRMVWGLPHIINILERIVAQDLVNYTSTFNQMRYSIGSNATTSGLTPFQLSNTIRRMRRHGAPMTTIDCKGFDQSVPTYFSSLFFSILASQINFGSMLDIQYFFSFFCYFTFTPYCYMSDRLRFKSKGVPSGSLITNLFDSFVTRTIVNYCHLKHTGMFPCDLCVVNGDDNLIVLKHITFDQLAKTYNDFGLIVNFDKTEVSTHDGKVSFNGYIWDEYDRPTQRDEWYLSHLVYPSRFLSQHQFPKGYLFTYRAISICMNLYGGMDFFMKYIGERDNVWRDIYKQYKHSGVAYIRYLGEDRRLLYHKFYLSDILKKDYWMHKPIE